MLKELIFDFSCSEQDLGKSKNERDNDWIEFFHNCTRYLSENPINDEIWPLHQLRSNIVDITLIHFVEKEHRRLSIFCGEKRMSFKISLNADMQICYRLTATSLDDAAYLRMIVELGI